MTENNDKCSKGDIFEIIFAILSIFILIFFTGFAVGGKCGYESAYKKGQIDYQKSIIKYQIEEVTTDIIRKLR